MGFLKLIVQVFFVCVELSWVGGRRVGARKVGARRVGAPKGGGQKGGGPNPEKVGARRVGARRVGAPTQKKWSPKGGGRKGGGSKGGGPKGGGPKFRAFFPSPAAKFVLFFPLWGSSRGFLVVFEAPGHSNVQVWALGLSCEAPAAPKPPGFHTTAREPKSAHLRVLVMTKPKP